MIGFFRPPPDAPDQPRSLVDRLYRRWQWSVFLSIVIGYTIFYVTRLSMSVSKSAMIDSGTLAVEQAGVIDAVFLVTYAVGKTANGFLADRVSIRRFFATALLVSSVMNLAFGLSSTFVMFGLLWAINGWAQSTGVPASGVVMASWFSTRELGTRYSIWSLAHHLGEGLTFLFSAHLISAATDRGAGPDAWRAAFLGPAALGFVTAVILFRTVADRPRSKGLPTIADHTGTPVPATPEPETLGGAQLAALKNPWILLCGVASGLIYVSRWAINNWGVYYLEHERGYSVEAAASALAIFPMSGIAGALLAGPISDRFARGMRVPVAVGYGVMFCGSLAVFYYASADSQTLVRIALGIAGVGMGGLLVFLGGLLAMELCSRRAAGAALGIIGGFSYAGAGVQAVLSGYLIDGDDFSRAKLLWLGAPCVAVVITALLWRPERRTKRLEPVVQ
ncbi:MAG: MFS transporter [Kofleriaceae bacterium]